MFRKICAFALLILVLAGIVLATEALEILFWTRPNPLWVNFWEEMAERYMASNPVVAGKAVKVKVMPMPEKPTSEAAIQMSIAAGTVADGSENIVTGFAHLLAKEGHLVPLDTLPGFWELMEKRAMKDLILRWKAPDGHIYLIPNFSNPKLYAWRMDILRTLGFGEPPKDYNQVFELGKRLKEKYPEKFLMADTRTVEPTWWKRWGDFFPFYYANTDVRFITESKLTADEEVVIKVFEFFHKLYDKGYLLTAKVGDPFPTGVCVWTRINSWDPLRWKTKFPELVFGRDYVVTGPVPAPCSEQPINFFTDEKGLVIYANPSPEEREAIWDFYKFVLSDVKNDIFYFETTGVLPVRGDVDTNPELSALRVPETALWSFAVSNAIPSTNHPKFAEILEALGAEGFIPALKGERAPEEAWKKAKAKILALLQEE